MRKAPLMTAAIALLAMLSHVHAQTAIIANESRVESRIRDLGLIGDTSLGILRRVAYSTGDIAARKYITGLMQSAGLSVRVDAGGNIIGSRKGTNASLRPIVLGSHTDAVPNGGIYDGDLGVISAIECIELLNEKHLVVYIISGSLVMVDNSHTVSFNSGDIYFCRRNNLVKYTKCPPDTGEYQSISIYFDQQTLRNISLEYGYKVDQHAATSAFQKIPSPAIGNYMRSLLAYETILKHKGADDLLFLKQKEAILLLLKLVPGFKNVLFDFSEPGKIDLEAFMEKNYHFNVQLKRFAYLTGRSLATFKRDFVKIYHTTPSRWLQQRRLQEAHHMIKELKKAPSEVYLELGFENLSHFSFAFKKAYGIVPSKL